LTFGFAFGIMYIKKLGKQTIGERMRDLLPELNEDETRTLIHLRKNVERVEKISYQNLNIFAHSVYGGKMNDDINSLKEGRETFFEQLSDVDREKIYEEWKAWEEESQEPKVLEFANEQEKRNYFELNKIFDNLYDERKDCLHCGQTISVADYNVVDDYICCPNYPDCDGTIIDWMPEGSLHSEEE